MPHRKRHEAAEARINQKSIRLPRRAHPGAVYRHGQPPASALRALQPAHHLVIRRLDVRKLFIEEEKEVNRSSKSAFIVRNTSIASISWEKFLWPKVYPFWASEFIRSYGLERLLNFVPVYWALIPDQWHSIYGICLQDPDHTILIYAFSSDMAIICRRE